MAQPTLSWPAHSPRPARKWDRKFFPEPPAAVTDETVREALRRAQKRHCSPRWLTWPAPSCGSSWTKIDDVFSLSMPPTHSASPTITTDSRPFNLLHKRARFQTHQYWSDAPIPDFAHRGHQGTITISTKL
uniref:Uncharacterized protein n=1 Tax=Macrostomum lignano TaxID=282301 RepID=A0A1I8FKZ6_9PLAT